VTPTEITRNNRRNPMTTLQLTPTQHAILEHAIDHTKGVIDWFPNNVKGGARQKVLESLNKRGLVRSVGLTWLLAPAGYEALGRVKPAPTVIDVKTELETNVSACEVNWMKGFVSAATRAQSALPAKSRTREHSKQATVVAMLRRPQGATVAQICACTGWQAHTVRGTFAGAFKKKLGLTITSAKPQGGERCYHIVATSADELLA